MVKVEITYEKNALTSLKVKGHADSGPYGKDLVCAAVTAILIGGANALEDDASGFEVTLEEGNASFVPTRPISEHDSIVLETVILQLKTIEVSPSTKGTLTIKERK
ncbi:MAG: ribosomal-processing cysteine protease Prp [Bacilli bacterium]|nr:ribosomal-processing cysteine protease Prp [Bacilli bacterium]